MLEAEAAIDAITTASTPHELITTWLARECGTTPEAYDSMYLRMVEWGAAYPHRGLVNTFSPIMLLEQARKEFDEAADFVLFAMVASDLQWGPRLLKLAEHDKPVWVMVPKGFPSLIAEAREKVQVGNDPRD